MLDTKEEQQYERLRKLGQELHIPIPEAFLTLEVFDKDGKLIQRHHQRSHSWVRNAYNMMFSQLAAKNGNGGAVFGAGFLNIKDTGGTVRTGEFGIGVGCYDPSSPAWTNLDTPHSSIGALATATHDDHGIVVGSGTNAESFEDYALQTLIVNGTDAGQLSYVASELSSVSYAALVLTCTLIRYFNNNSGDSIDVNEVALVIGGMAGSSGSAIYNWVQSRDHLASTVTVPVTGQLRVTYTVQLTYPS